MRQGARGASTPGGCSLLRIMPAGTIFPDTLLPLPSFCRVSLLLASHKCVERVNRVAWQRSSLVACLYDSFAPPACRSCAS